MDETPQSTIEGRLAFYHPTSTGRGAAVRFELHPARRGHDGYMFAEIAAQKTLASRSTAGIKGATFDWDAKIGMKLGITDVCALLAVLEGKTASAGGEKGLFHQSTSASTVIGFRRVDAPSEGFCLEVSRKEKQAGATDPVRLRVVLSEAEGIGLRQVLAASIFHLCFYAVPAIRD
ncbi:MAG TPA: hypothetical protein DCS43_00015 [Verrucomicrobia bacterium]|nr:hypothetical protein [Verrucomicrobiota bacterium]